MNYPLSFIKHKNPLKTFACHSADINRAMLLRNSTGLATSLTLTRQLGFHSLSFIQVTRFSQLSLSPLFSPLTYHNTKCNHINLHQKVFFSSKPQSFVDLILSRDWSEEIEIELDELDPKLTYEYVVYTLMKLNKNPQKCLDFFNWVSVKKGFDPSFVPYTLLLRSLACEKFVNDFWIIALEMREKRFYIDVHVYFSVLGDLKHEKMVKTAADWNKFYKELCDVYDRDEYVKGVVKLMLEYDWSEELKGKLKTKLTLPLTENFMLRVLRDVRKQPLRALKFFEWVGSCGGYEHDIVSYNAMLRVLAGCETIQEFWEFVERMKRKGFEVDFDTLIKMFRHLPIGDAVKLFEFMMDGPYKPSLRECNLLLRLIWQEPNPDMELANRVVNSCVAAGNTLSKSEYDGMHRILCKLGKFDEAKKIVQEMRDAGYMPDNTTYSQEIDDLCRRKMFEEACKLLHEMESNGCVPNVKTWTILLQGYCEADQVDDALSCYFRMSEKNVDPDADTLQALLNGFLSNNKVLDAYRFLVETVNKGQIKPRLVTFQLTIEKLADAGTLKEAINLLILMKTQGYPPFPEPIIQYISKSGTVDDAKKVLQALTSKTAPSSGAYVKIVKLFFEEGRESEAKDLIYSSPYRVLSQPEIRSMLNLLKFKALVR